MPKQQKQLDSFSRKRLAAIHGKFMQGQTMLEKSASMARMGFLLTQFDDLDLLALSRAGLLTYGDIAALVHMGRLPKTENPTF